MTEDVIITDIIDPELPTLTQTSDDFASLGVFTRQGNSIANDAYYNPLYKLGATPLNGSNANYYSRENYSNNELLCREIYRGSWLARKSVNLVAEEMLRGGIEIKGIDVDKIEALQAMWDEFGMDSKLEELIINGRLFGGAIGVIVVAGQKLDTPFNIDRVSKDSFEGFKVFNRWRTSTMLEYDPMTGYPTSYQLIVTTANSDPKLEVTQVIEKESQGGLLPVSATRVLRYDGDYLPHLDFINNMHWHASILDRLMETISNYMTSSAALTSMSRNATIKVYKISNLTQKLAQISGEGARRNLEDMLRRITVSAGVEGITVIDADSSIDLLATTVFEGAVKASEFLRLDFCANLGAPYTKIFGDSASGMNATGEGDARNWYDSIEARRKQLKPGVMKLLKVMYRSLFGTAPPATLRFEFAPLWQHSETEKADVAQKKTAAIIQAFSASAITDRVALEELRKLEENVNMFGSITDEDIETAKDVDPPEPTADEEGLITNNDKIDAETGIKDKDGKEKQVSTK